MKKILGALSFGIFSLQAMQSRTTVEVKNESSSKIYVQVIYSQAAPWKADKPGTYVPARNLPYREGTKDIFMVEPRARVTLSPESTRSLAIVVFKLLSDHNGEYYGVDMYPVPNHRPAYVLWNGTELRPQVSDGHIPADNVTQEELVTVVAKPAHLRLLPDSLYGRPIRAGIQTPGVMNQTPNAASTAQTQNKTAPITINGTYERGLLVEVPVYGSRTLGNRSGSKAHSLEWSKNGMHIFIGKENNAATLWSQTSPQELTSKEITFQAPGGSEGKIVAAAFSPDSKKVLAVLAGSASINQIILLDFEKQTLNFAASSDYALTSVAFSRDGDHFLVASSNNRLEIYETTTGDLKYILPSGTSKITALVCSQAGDYFLRAHSNGLTQILDLSVFWGEVAVNALQNIDQDPMTVVTAAAFSSNGKLVALGLNDQENNDHAVEVREVATGRLVRTWGTRSAPLSLACRPSTLQVAAGMQNGSVRLWDAETGKPLLMLNIDDGPITSIVFNSDGSEMLTASNTSPNTRLWQLKDILEIQSFLKERGSDTDELFFKQNRLLIALVQNLSSRSLTFKASPDEWRLFKGFPTAVQNWLAHCITEEGSPETSATSAQSSSSQSSNSQSSSSSQESAMNNEMLAQKAHIR
jgi:WD40 repeat protein